MSQLFDYYKSLLAAARLIAEEDGSIKSLQGTGARKTHFVKGKPLKMPYSSVLNDDNVREYAIFHPFGESIAKGESEVLEDLRKRTISTIGLCTMSLIEKFVSLAAAERHPQQLDPVQTRMLVVAKEVDEKTAKSITSILASILTSGNTNALWPVKIFLARNGSTCREEETRHYSRWANISFPLYSALQEEINNKPDKGNARKFAGVTTNEKTLKALAALLEYIFPNIEKEGYYSQGSDSELAPFAHAFMKGSSALMLQLNETIKVFDNIDGFSDLTLPSDWMGAIEDLDEMHYEIGKIPVHGSLTATRTTQQATEQPNQMGVATSAPARTIHPNQVKQAEQAQEPEFIMGPNGMRPNPKFYQRLGGGSWGMMQRVNPYDPRGDGQVILPSGAVPASQPSGGGWGLSTAWG